MSYNNNRKSFKERCRRPIKTDKYGNKVSYVPVKRNKNDKLVGYITIGGHVYRLAPFEYSGESENTEQMIEVRRVETSKSGGKSSF